MKLRPYQNRIINETRALMQKGSHSILIQSPTGSGKTLLTAHMLGSAAQKGLASWFIVHRRELVKQSVQAFVGEGINHGIISAKFKDAPTEQVQIASVQTLIRRFQKYDVPKLIVWDECHHVAAKSWAKLFAAFPDSYHIGLTATPERLDGTGLYQWFNDMVQGPNVQWLIANGFLSDYKIYAPSSPDLTKVRTRMGDYVGSELSAIIDRPSITGDAISHYVKHANGKRAVVFCASIIHSRHVTELFNQHGIPALHVDGDTPTEQRDEAIERFKSGSVKVLSNVDLFGEGFDVPCIEAAILLRPTKSLGLYLQQVGRSLRAADNKTHSIILDHAGNCQRHGLPDEERDWSLQGREKKKKGSEPSNVRICPECFHAQRRGPMVCSQCGHQFVPDPREIQQRDGELAEVNKEQARKKKRIEQGQAQTLEALVELGEMRGYKNPYWWARQVLESRQRKGRVFA